MWNENFNELDRWVKIVDFNLHRLYIQVWWFKNLMSYEVKNIKKNEPSGRIMYWNKINLTKSNEWNWIFIKVLCIFFSWIFLRVYVWLHFWLFYYLAVCSLFCTCGLFIFISLHCGELWIREKNVKSKKQKKYERKKEWNIIISRLQQFINKCDMVYVMRLCSTYAFIRLLECLHGIGFSMCELSNEWPLYVWWKNKQIRVLFYSIFISVLWHKQLLLYLTVSIST